MIHPLLGAIAVAVFTIAGAQLSDTLQHWLWEAFHWAHMDAQRRLDDLRHGREVRQLTTSVAVAAFAIPDEPEPAPLCSVCGSPDCCADEHSNRGMLEAKEAIEARRLGQLGALTLRMEILAAQVEAEVRRPLTSDERKAVAARVTAALQEVRRTHPKT